MDEFDLSCILLINSKSLEKERMIDDIKREGM
jgi:hypothetical protein